VALAIECDGLRCCLWRVKGHGRPVKGDRKWPSDRERGTPNLVAFRHLDTARARIWFAADILRTAVAPTWDDISKLAVIATIRAMLNYFLAKDILAFDKSQEAGQERGVA
jgi:Protein of unknown function (DUF1622)